MKRKRRKYNRDHHRYVAYLFILFLLTSLSIIIFSSLKKVTFSLPLFYIKNVSSNIKFSSNYLSYLKDKNILSLDIGLLRKNLLKKYPQYREIVIEKKMPSTLIIRGIKRGVYAAFKKDDKFYLLDREGVVIEQTHEPLDFVVVIDNYTKDIKIGDKIAISSLKKAFYIIKNLRKDNFFSAFKPIFVNTTNIDETFLLMKDVKVIIGRGDIKKRLEIFKKLFREVNSSNRGVKAVRDWYEYVTGKSSKEKYVPAISYIDLRYRGIPIGLRR